MVRTSVAAGPAPGFRVTPGSRASGDEFEPEPAATDVCKKGVRHPVLNWRGQGCRSEGKTGVFDLRSALVYRVYRGGTAEPLHYINHDSILQASAASPCQRFGLIDTARIGQPPHGTEPQRILRTLSAKSEAKRIGHPPQFSGLFRNRRTSQNPRPAVRGVYRIASL